MKTFAILLVVGIGGYAVYDLFKNNKLFAAAGTQPGTISRVGTSVPGVPIYSAIGTTASNLAGTVTEAQTAVTDFTAAFGPTDDSSDDYDTSDLLPVSSGSSSYFDGETD